MGRPKKSYFSEAQSDGERSGLLASASQDAITDQGQYEGLGRTPAPHSLSAPAGLDSAAWEEEIQSGTGPTQDSGRSDRSQEPEQEDLLVIT